MPRPAWIVEHAARQSDQVRIPRLQYRLRLIEIRDQAHRHDGDADRLLDGARERHLIAGTNGHPGVRSEAAAGHMDRIATMRLQRLREFHG